MIDGLAPNEQTLEAAERAVDEAWYETLREHADQCVKRAAAVESEARDLARAAFIVLGICALAFAAILAQAIRTAS